MEVTGKQEQKLTSMIMENWEIALNTNGKICGMIEKYLNESNKAVGGENPTVNPEERPVSEDRITNLMNRLDDTNGFIRNEVWGHLKAMCEKLERL